MDPGVRLSQMYAEQLIEERLREAARHRRLAALGPALDVRRAAASALVRLGLRLHPAAGEGLPAPLLKRAESGR